VEEVEKISLGFRGWEHPRVQGELEQTVFRVYPEAEKRNSATLWNQVRANRALLRPLRELLGIRKAHLPGSSPKTLK